MKTKCILKERHHYCRFSLPTRRVSRARRSDFGGSDICKKEKRLPDDRGKKPIAEVVIVRRNRELVRRYSECGSHFLACRMFAEVEYAAPERPAYSR